MCGIAGIVGQDLPIGEMPALVARVQSSLRHRGPDDGGYFLDERNKLALIHQRLAVVDLSPDGHQPMQSASGRFVIVYNGEVYNFRELRDELSKLGYAFRGGSDTETVLSAIEQWGLAGASAKFRGMFALAVWDRSRNTLSLVRDRIGEKPLYYGKLANKFVFASELKAIRALVGESLKISPQAVADFLTYLYVPTPKSIYESIYKLEPGSILTIEVAGGATKVLPIVHFWRISDVADVQPRHSNSAEYIHELEERLVASVREQMLADVPVGAFLSGGIDSTTIVAMMQRLGGRAAKTYTVGFKDAEFNEAVYASKVAKFLGTEHHELLLTETEAQAIIAELPAIYDEPFADASQIPVVLMSRFAKRDVTVCLSGDGGDELFGGYNRYVWGDKVWKSVSRLPTGMRQKIGSSMSSVNSGYINRILHVLGPKLPERMRFPMLGYKIQKIIRCLSAESREDVYQRLVTHCVAAPIFANAGAVQLSRDHVPAGDPSQSFPEWMMRRDMGTYLVDDILVKLDRGAMSAGLETRAPFLDIRLVEFALNLPLELKIRNGEGKWLVKRMLEKYVPKDFLNRPKTGFAVPIGKWLKGALRPWAEELLSVKTLSEQGLFDPSVVRMLWDQHTSGQRDWHEELWAILMFQAWIREQ